MITYHFELNTQPNKRGKYVVFLRLTENRKKKRVQTTIELSRPADWNKDAEKVRKSEPYAESWNSVLDAYRERAKDRERALTDQFGTPTIEQVANRLTDRGHKTTLIAYALERKETKSSYGSWERWGQAINKLQGYIDAKHRGQDIVFKEVTPAFVDGFKAYLQKLPNSRDKARGLSPNTIAKELKILKAVLNCAIADGLMPQDQMPANLKTIKETPSAVVGLEQWELDALLQLALPAGSKLWDARNLYFFAYYCAGMRLGDLLQLRWCYIDGDRLTYQMDKTNKGKNIKLFPQMWEILNLYRTPTTQDTDYIFPYLCNNKPYAKFITLEQRQIMPEQDAKALYVAVKAREQKIAQAIKELATLAGVRPFTFHSSRHTFAMQAKDKGIDSYTIKGMLNHSSLSTTEIYLQRLDNSKEDIAMERILADNPQDKAGELIAKLKGLGLDASTILELLNK